MPADRMICHGLTSYSPGRSKVTAYSSTLSSSFPSKSSSVWQSSLVMSSPLSTPLGTRGSKLISLAVKTALKERETIHDTDNIGTALRPRSPLKKSIFRNNHKSQCKHNNCTDFILRWFLPCNHFFLIATFAPSPPSKKY